MVYNIFYNLTRVDMLIILVEEIETPQEKQLKRIQNEPFRIEKEL